MPRLITSVEQFEELKSSASQCRVVRTDKVVKLKLRTPSYLYTYLANPDAADDLIKGLKDIEVIEFSRAKKVEKESEKKKEKDEESE